MVYSYIFVLVSYTASIMYINLQFHIKIITSTDTAKLFMVLIWVSEADS